MSLLVPTYAEGFATSPGESERPEAWDGLVGAWVPSLGVTGLNLWDQSINSNHGTLTNGPTWVSASRGGWALDFDGSSHYVALGNLSSYFSTEATIIAWIRIDVDPPLASGSSGLWRLTGELSDASHYPFTDGTIYDATFRDDRLAVGAGLIADLTQWHQVAITQKPGANGWNFYQNAHVAHSAAGESQVFIDSVAYLGRSVAEKYLSGQIGPVLIYNRALAPSEISKYYADSEAMWRPRQEVFPAAVAPPAGNPWYHYTQQTALVG